MARSLIAVLVIPLVVAACGSSADRPLRNTPPRTAGLRPLSPLESNRRYFTDGSGRAVYLTGFHTWNNLVDRGDTSPPERFDFTHYLDELARYRHNFIRLWAWELPRYLSGGKTWYTGPQPWLRTGPGTARDGLPKFDLGRFDDRYFTRLRARVEAANWRGIYVSVMLFEGWEGRFAESPLRWTTHPLYQGNNVNGVAADPNRDGHGLEYFTLRDPDVLAVQRAYVRHVVATVADLPNVLFEVSNEADRSSTSWQLTMKRLVRRELTQRGVSRPVGLTFQHDGSNDTLYGSSADWISPGGRVFLSDPPLAESGKVSIVDTDHLCGVCGDHRFVWESFLRGYNVIFMDDLSSAPAHEGARVAMGQARAYANRIDLAHMAPRTDLTSTRFCLAHEGVEYLVYQPTSGRFTVDLGATSRWYKVEWFRPSDGRRWSARRILARLTTTFRPPFPGEGLLYLKAV